MAMGEGMARRARGEQTVQFLVDRNRLEGFEADDLAALTEAQIGRAVLRVETTDRAGQGPAACRMRCLGLDDPVAARPDGGAQGDGGAQKRPGKHQRQQGGTVELDNQLKSAQV